jgi:putative peptidoglycan lipid II flippase
MEFPTGMLGVALGTILLPSLAKHHAARSAEEYSRLLDWGLRITLLLAAPAAAALAILSVPLVTTLIQYGAYSTADSLATRDAVIAYSLGLVGLILVKVLAPGFYATQNIRTPVKIALVTLTTTQLMNLAFIWHLRHVGLALAISLGACLNAALLYSRLRRHAVYVPQPGWRVFLLKLIAAVAVMAAVLWFASGSADDWLTSRARERVIRLTWVIVSGAGAYFASLWAFGFRLRHFTQRAAE